MLPSWVSADLLQFFVIFVNYCHAVIALYLPSAIHKLHVCSYDYASDCNLTIDLQSMHLINGIYCCLQTDMVNMFIFTIKSSN